ncbi:MAG: methyl-accepting chemotaxis protein [Desulfobacteraceae bacterium]|nr:methyl-accepting chemotaxis protein [Desulfobacteraceae bacterium]
MKKFHSIGFKLVAGGILVVMIPLLIVGTISTTKSANALMDISKVRARDTAMDLARLTRHILDADLTLVKILAAKHQVVQAALLESREDTEELSYAIADLHANLEETRRHISDNYEGFFVTDARGKVFSGVRAKGMEYVDFSVAGRDYFKEVKATGEAAMGAMERSRSSRNLVCVAAAPITSPGGAFLGIFGLVIKADHIISLVADRKIGNTGYGFMVDEQGLMVAHPAPKCILSLNINSVKGQEVFANKMVSGETGVCAYSFQGDEKISGFAPVERNHWYVAATQDAGEFLATAHAIRNFTIGIGLCSVALTVVLVFFMARAMVNPLNAAVKGLKDIAEGEGDLTMRLGVTSRDEIGELASWFNTFLEKLQAIIRQIKDNAVHVEESSTGLSAIAVQLSSGAGNTATRANAVAAATEEMSASVATVAAAMEQSSTNTAMVASAAEEMNATITEISKNAEQARAITVEAVERSRGASDRMSELGRAALAIGKVTETITDISEQTNLLALNATIEAARAGEAGKGFAVVANEIKALAMQTAEATLDIRTQIEGVQNSTTISGSEIREISDVIDKVNEIVATIAAAVGEQSSVTNEIADNIGQVSQGVQEVNQNVAQCSQVADEISSDITQVDSQAEEISSGSGQVKLSAEGLSAMSMELTKLVGRFKV